jgi:glycosyltransferase involved in cell wall biosynthesis
MNHEGVGNTNGNSGEVRGDRFNITFFAQLPYNHLHIGRTRFLADELALKGFDIYFVGLPELHNKSKLFYPRRGKENFLNNILPNSLSCETKIKIISGPLFFPTLKGSIKSLNSLNERIRDRWYHYICERTLSTNVKSAAIVSTPAWTNVIKELKYKPICYDCIDDISVLSNSENEARYRELHINLLGCSDLVFYSAKEIGRGIATVYPNKPRHYIPNGVDVNWFHNISKHQHALQDLQGLQKPIVGYIGGFFKWVDIDLLKSAASEMPNVSFVFIGITDISQKDKVQSLKKHQNVHLLGPKVFSLIPSYIKSFDVCLIPFKMGEIANRTNPVKVYEYLAFGKPVISTNLPELNEMRPHIYMANNSSEFINKLKLSLNENDEVLRNQRIQFATMNSWSARANSILQIMTENTHSCKL